MRIPIAKSFREAVRIYTPRMAAAIIERFVYERTRGRVWCDACGSYRIASRKAGHYCCRDCGAEFDLLTDTVAHGSRLGVRAWLVAVWCICPGGDRISTADLARGVGISQSSARRMLRRVRERCCA